MWQLYKWNQLVMETWWWYQAGTGIGISNSTITNTWVTSVNWKTWVVVVEDIIDQDTYDNLPSSKLTDWVIRWIYEDDWE
jgi:hypothetical protein